MKALVAAVGLFQSIWHSFHARRVHKGVLPEPAKARSKALSAGGHSRRRLDAAQILDDASPAMNGRRLEDAKSAQPSQHPGFVGDEPG